MLKRAFTYLLLVHLTGALTLSSLTGHSDAVAHTPEPSAAREESTFSADDVDPLLNLLGDILSGAGHRDAKNRGDNLSDFFRIRKYTYRFLLWDTCLTENFASFHTIAWKVVKPRGPALFQGLVTLPEYYRLLFRLKPF